MIAGPFGLAAGVKGRERPAGRHRARAVVFSHWLLDLVVHRGDLPMTETGPPVP